MSVRQLEAIYARARREAFPVVRDRLRATLPPGWRCVLAVGWGITVFDAAGATVQENGPIYHGDSPRKMPARLKQTLEVAEKFGDLYGLGNEEITGR